MKARLHVQRWSGSAPAGEDSVTTALLHGVLELDGQLVNNAKVKIETGGDEVMMLTAELLVTEFEVVAHYEDTWRELDLP